MTIGAVPIFHKRKKSKKKVSNDMTIAAVPIFHLKKVSDEMTIGAVPIL